MRRVTLLTDFGTGDGYVAAMKGVLAGRAPDALVEDASHEVPPGDVNAAAWALHRYWRLYPEGTVHVVVVDPGVGSARRALGAEVDGRFFVAPDNGVLSLVFREAAPTALVALEERRFFRAEVSATFHGRDVFAPVAAALATGARLAELGPPVDNPLRLVWPEPREDGTGVAGEVVHIDRFGNLITNVPGARAAGGLLVRVGDRVVGPLRRTYAEVDPGELLALIGSAGLLEVAVRDGSAAEMLEVERGAGVTLEGL